MTAILSDEAVHAPDVVLVEDNDDDALLFVRAVKALKPNWSVRRFATGGEARDFLERSLNEPERVPGAIFTDLELPGMHGAELIGWIQEQPALIETKLFVISGHVTEPMRAPRRDNRHIWFFPKPTTAFSVAMGLSAE